MPYLGELAIPNSHFKHVSIKRLNHVLRRLHLPTGGSGVGLYIMHVKIGYVPQLHELS